MWHKRGPLSDLLYLALIVSVIRPDTQRLVNDDIINDNFGGSSVDDYGPTSVDNLYIDNLRDSLSSSYYNSYANSAKANILLEETLNVLREVNSLGQYSRPNRFNSQLFAYLVNEGDESIPIDAVASASTSSSSIHPLNEQRLSVNISSNPSPVSVIEGSSLALGFDNTVDVNETLLDEVLKSNLYDDPDGDYIDAGFVESNLEDLDLDDLEIGDIPSPIVAHDPMLPNLRDDDDADSLFDELERLLCPEDTEFEHPLQSNSDGFIDDWNGTNQMYQNGATSALLPYDANENAANIYFDNGNGHHNSDTSVAAVVNANMEVSNYNPANAIGSTNIGSAMAASIATLTNGSEPLPDIGSSATVYGSELNDLIYLNNATATVNGTSAAGGEYLLTDLLSDEDLQLMEMTGTNASASSNGTAFAHYYQHQYNSFRSSNINNGTVTEDRMDASSDSAVSSMSSDRVHSLSDGDWIDSCSETSSQHGDALHEYGHHPNSIHRHHSQSAQKKYKLFGRRSDNKEDAFNYYHNVSMDNELQGNNSSTYSDYSSTHINDYACNDMASAQPNISYYNPSVSHNHTYVQSAEMAALGSYHQTAPISSASKSFTRRPLNSRSTLSETNDYISEIDQQLNRDEKRAKALRIPITTPDIINLPIDEFNERLAKYELSESQLSLIRDIRRRGKNKVAAQNCRKRKLDQIMGLQTDVDSMFAQKEMLYSHNEHLLLLRQMARDKYAKLYQFILEASSAQQNQYGVSNFPPDYPHHHLERELENGNHNSFIVSTNATNNNPLINSQSTNFHEKIDKHD